MKKLLAYVGLATVGATTMHAQFNPGLTPQELAQPWSVAATVRGFYDDNIFTEPSSVALPNGTSIHRTPASSYGVEFSPQLSWNYAPEQTTIGLNYVYDLKYYDRRNNGETLSHVFNASDQSHLFNANLNHIFSERDKMMVAETFIYTDEPLVGSSGLIATPLISAQTGPQRTLLANIHNTAMIGNTLELTKLLDLGLSYQNDLYAYDFGPAESGPGGPSAELDRMEQLASVNLDWKYSEALTAILGYQYEHVGYTSPLLIIAPNVYSKVRNNDSHFAYVGADEQFTPQLTGRIRVGGQFVDYYNAPTAETSIDPYVDASLTWEYMRASTAQAGVKYQHNPTDVTGASTTGAQNPVLDSDSTAVYVNLTQKIAGSLTGSLLGQWQHSVFNEPNGPTGASAQFNDDGKFENFMVFGVNLSYRFNPYFSAETGYNWNKLNSHVINADTERDYTRDVVYVGVKGEF